MKEFEIKDKAKILFFKVKENEQDKGLHVIHVVKSIFISA
jgi:hypothetical protein